MQKKPKKFYWFLWAAIISVIAFLLSPFMLYRLKYRAEFNQKVRELAAAGFPVSFDDLEAAYVLPEGVENAADIYLKAFAVYTEPNEAEQELLPVSGNYERQDDQPPYPKEVMDAVISSLDKNRECLELLHQAARIEHCLFPRTRTEWGFDIEHLSPLKKAAQVLAERNLYLAQTGQTDALFESTRTCIGLRSSLSEQPQLIDHLVNIAIQAMLAAGVEDSLNLTQFTSEQLTVLQDDFRSMRKANDIAKAYPAERVSAIEYCNLPFRKQVEGLGSWWGFGDFRDKSLMVLYIFSGLREKDAVLLMDFHDRRMEAAKLPPHEQLTVLEKIDNEINSYSIIHWYLHALSPALTRINQINLRVIGSLQCTETALAIERYRLTYNALPESLDSLVPEFIDTVLLDPFDGKPLRYRLGDDGGYTVYHIGEDGIDNGGRDKDQMSKTSGTRPKEYDWPFTVK